VTAGRVVADVTLHAAAVSDPGMKRKGNEDSYLAESPVFIVADGMGGYEALVAADLGVATVAASTTRGAGSTVTGLVLVMHDEVPHWLVVNVGDSRVYRHENGDLEQLTVDHSLGQELVDKGELTREGMATFSERNVITRAIGASDSTADSWLMPVMNGERMLVCSDGLHSELGDEAIRAILTMSGKPESAAAALVQRANASGGRDNVTVIVVDVVKGGSDFAGEYTTGALHLTSEALNETTIPVMRGGARG
jgi:PPM family protein phosphatase